MSLLIFGGEIIGAGNFFAIEVEVVVVFPSGRHGSIGEPGGAQGVGPSGEFFAEGSGGLGVFINEVVHFAGIVFKVEEVLSFTTDEEFPFVLANGGLGNPTPLEGAVWRGVFFEMRDDVDAIEGRLLDSGK